MPDPAQVNAMFGRIARRYDLANRVLSQGRDGAWRRRLAEAVRRAGPTDVLDLATGSGDVAFALSRSLPPRARILGVDFCEPMLEEARRKQAAGGPGFCANVRFAAGDGMALPFSEGSFDAVTISFGLRNMPDRHRSLLEMRRVLRPGGRLFILEFSQPARWLRPVCRFYNRVVLPAVAGVLTGERPAYEYLNDTVAAFPGREALAREIGAAAFSGVSATPLTFGIVALHEAAKS